MTDRLSVNRIMHCSRRSIGRLDLSMAVLAVTTVFCIVSLSARAALPTVIFGDIPGIQRGYDPS
ncbi:hypothetical protein [Compostibacter hankyongensis]|uniref:hypothetical protein n=1 Tax=Compostibacter hankyongensis TaxID=1007089 RepID=UPI0031EDC0FB